MKELTNKVGVNRGTFYIHYQDINSLWGEIEEETLAEIHKLGSVIKDYELTDAEDLQEPIKATLEVLHYLKSNEIIFKPFWGKDVFIYIEMESCHEAIPFFESHI
ncbi:hypothetical protein PSTEL_06275 [Paenibacillus stellifer]|uniref:HTH tetR-type domain-containing protein n=1 Tax=Paenibacillus stellifer TaxID=169760 RepID=A0A089LU61_9BACL|nr:hypothetical protein [Paenibacillus stellifer]AIQ62763.1 hypothetical protein PSTEL_06275 [Paenibacillus stellifer]